MAWDDLLKLLRRSRQSENITNPPYSPPVQIRRGQKALDIARLSDTVYTKIRLAVLETLTVSDSANYLQSRLQQSVGDIISVSDLIDYLIHEYIRQNVSDNLSVSDAVNYVLSSINRISAAASDSVSLSELLKALRKDFAPSETLSLSENVSYQLTTPPFYIIPNSYTVYNHNLQQISANLSVWWDENTSTTYSVYYTPFAPNNPRYVFLYFNNSIRLPRSIDIYILGYTTGKTLYVVAFYLDNPVSTASITPSSTGWATITVPIGADIYFDELEIYVDSNSFGFVAIGEFHVLQ
jgi:hypothetical protein